LWALIDFELQQLNVEDDGDIYEKTKGVLDTPSRRALK